ncbi:hypothetical protein [Nubsella zeaxanthinifaciens]|uniref:hypothetical protein n=1 Tax=Nubsella zeaxanthinifaciens TaxID=392412 RepID=UPI000DE42D1E|nr:hypothetical protein [Nubsella zeaxanthinifaciens]
MLVVNKPMALIGLFLLLIAAFCPILQVQIIFKLVSWTLYKTDVRLFLITYALVALMGLSFFVRQLRAFKILTRVMFGWVILMAVAVYFKSTHYFNFKIADNLLGKTIHFEWGWIILLIGSVLLLFSVKKPTLAS